MSDQLQAVLKGTWVGKNEGSNKDREESSVKDSDLARGHRRGIYNLMPSHHKMPSHHTVPKRRCRGVGEDTLAECHALQDMFNGEIIHER